jgi:predicted nucleic-acid-binding protein
LIALDTNLLIRLVVRDDITQADLVVELMRANETWLAKTVLLESEWVLRYTYELNREAIAEIFRKVLGFRRLMVEDRINVLRALDYFDQGMDFADALHLCSSGAATSFATFDRALARKATACATRPAVELVMPHQAPA